MSVSTLGSKGRAGVFQTIINLIPPHDTYIEPFLGTGVVLLKKAPSVRTIGVDLLPECVAKERFVSVPDVELHQTEGIAFLRNFDFDNAGRTVTFCDPPSLAQPGGNFRRHDHDFSVAQHEELISVLMNLPGKVLLSGSPSQMYARRLEGWWSTSFQVRLRGGVITEKIWANFDPKQMHFHSYAGKDCADRQRVKRKASRWASNFSKLEHGERQAVLAAILSVET